MLLEWEIERGSKLKGSLGRFKTWKEELVLKLVFHTSMHG